MQTAPFSLELLQWRGMKHQDHQPVMGSTHVTLVTEVGEDVGSLDVFAAHRHPAKLHRAPSVWLKNENDQVLLQKRSDQKITCPGEWGNAICGNVSPEETVAECAQRRLCQELGLQRPPTLQELYTFTYRAYANKTYGEYEFDHVFVGNITMDEASKQLSPNPNEVHQVAWANIDKLLAAAETIPLPTPEETVALTTDQLKENVTSHQLAITLTDAVSGQEIASENHLLVPWTLLMLQDQRLQKWLNKKI